MSTSDGKGARIWLAMKDFAWAGRVPSMGHGGTGNPATDSTQS